MFNIRREKIATDVESKLREQHSSKECLKHQNFANLQRWCLLCLLNIYFRFSNRYRSCKPQKIIFLAVNTYERQLPISLVEHSMTALNTKWLNPCSKQWEMFLCLKSSLHFSAIQQGYRRSFFCLCTTNRLSRQVCQPSPTPSQGKTRLQGVGEMKFDSTFFGHKRTCKFYHYCKIYLHLRKLLSYYSASHGCRR